ncbi:MAG: type II toxin-antitoxin system mRNA interferase toxin, RelE/StbE family [archaeon]
MYALDISAVLDKKLSKLRKKNKTQLEIINKKVQQILQTPYHFKPLCGDMHGEREVHIDSHFVLTYEIDEEKKIVRLLDYDHHDAIFG